MWVYACVRFIYEFYSWYYWWWCFSRASFLSYKNNESLISEFYITLTNIIVFDSELW